jgi:hypothetical protein
LNQAGIDGNSKASKAQNTLEHPVMRKTIMKIRPAFPVLLALALPIALTACGTADNAEEVADLDEKLVGKGSDPAMKAALEDRILVDPDLAESANSNMVKAAEKPLDGAVPPDAGYEGAVVAPQELEGSKLLRAPKPKVIDAANCTDCGAQARTLEDLAIAQGAKRGKGSCADKLQYGASWATRMPTEFPVYPKSRVKEAGGVEGGICDIRAVSFNTSASRQSVADYYYTRAKRSGFSADYEIRNGEHVLGGVRDNDSGAFVVSMNDLPGGGTAVEIVANNGR